VNSPEVKPNRINLDTGCVYDGTLTALDLSKMKFIHVEKGIKSQPAKMPFDGGEGARYAMRFQGRMPVRAGTVGGARREYETLNFNQFGLLIRDAGSVSLPTLRAGDAIEGEIGRGLEYLIDFTGHVVRVEVRGAAPLYGIQIDRVSSGAEGRYWIERPEVRK
jgi:hypothetical protein